MPGSNSGPLAAPPLLPGMSMPALQVSGSTIDDQSGYMRQLRGQRYDFIPAHEVDLIGKETSLVAWVLPDGSVGTSHGAAPRRSAHHPGITLARVIRGAALRTAAAAGRSPDSAFLSRPCPCPLAQHHPRPGHIGVMLRQGTVAATRAWTY